jgi:hypothetical protein
LTTSNWIAVLGIAVALLSFAVPLLLRRADRQRIEIEKYKTENQLLRDTNIDLKIQLAGLQRVGNVIDRTFSGISTQRSEGSST